MWSRPSSKTLLLGSLILAGGTVLLYSSPSLFVLGPVLLVGYLLLLCMGQGFWQRLLVLLALYLVQLVHSNADFLMDGTFTLKQSLVVLGVGAGYCTAVALALHLSRGVHKNMPVGVAGIVYLFEVLSELALLGNHRLPYSLGYFLVDSPLQEVFSLVGVRASPVLVAGLLQLALQRKVFPASAVALALMVPWVLSGLEKPVQSPVGFSVVQTGVPVALYQDYAQDTAEQQKTRLANLLQDHTSGVLLFPETAIPDPFYYRLPHPEVKQLLGHKTALLGGVYNGPEGVTNTVMQHQEGRLQPVYHKRILVPLTEDNWLWSGSQMPLAEVQGVKVGIGICFEAVLSAPLREQVQQGAELLYVATNTQSLTAYRYQTIGMRSRALETHRTVLVASLPGKSMVIEASGQITQQGNWKTAEVLTAQPALFHHQTPFVRYGQWMVWVVLVQLALQIFRSWPWRRIQQAASRQRQPA